MAAALLAVIGVGFISFSCASSGTPEKSSGSGLMFGLSLGLASATANALQAVHVRKLMKLSIDPLQLVFAGYAGMFGLALLLSTKETMASMSETAFTSYDFFLIVCFTFFGLVGQMCSLLAVGHISAARMLVIGTLQVALSFAAQVAMGRTPGVAELAGAACVVGGVLFGALGGKEETDGRTTLPVTTARGD
jgi:drug/metabolite transporter (DMT)-like permease